MKALIFTSFLFPSLVVSACPILNAKYEACAPAENEEETLMPIAITTEVINGVYQYSIDTLTPIAMPSSMPAVKLIADGAWRPELAAHNGDIVQARVVCEGDQILRHEQVLDQKTKAVKSNTVTSYALQGKSTLLFKLLASGADLRNDVKYTQLDVLCVMKSLYFN